MTALAFFFIAIFVVFDENCFCFIIIIIVVVVIVDAVLLFLNLLHDMTTFAVAADNRWFASTAKCYGHESDYVDGFL